MRKFTILFFASIILGIATASAQYADVTDLNYPTGGYPWGALTQSGNLLYGMNSNGGANGEGCIFSININGSGYTDIFDFNGTNGANPYGSLTISGGAMFGMTSSGGTNGQGNVFAIHTDGSGYKDLLDFNGSNGAYPEGSLVLDNSGVLYGMTEDGGANHVGRIFSIDSNGAGYADVLDFNTANGANPTGSLTISGSQLYGMTAYGGSNGDGCVFTINTSGSGYDNLLNFTGSNGANPQGGLVLSGGILYGMTSRGGTNHYGRIFSITTAGSGYTNLLDFNNTNGALPYGSLILAPTGLLYGMTEDGGANGYGCMFSIQMNGSGYSDMYDFNYTNGGNPEGSLLFSAGVLYGMTTYGGANDNGVIFDNNTCTLGLTIGSVNNILCFSNTGSATAVISGGISPYTYNWSNGNTTATASGLSGGSYTVTVTDLNTCVATASVTITEPAAALSASTSIISQVSCGGYSNGNVTANASGGISPYSYSWSNGISTVSTSNPTGAILIAGSYTVTVTDANSCTTTASVTLTQPVPIRDSIVTMINVGCNGGNGGSATIGVKGGKFPYTYQWAPNSNTTKFASSLSAGTYTVTVTDNNGCINALSIVITQPSAIRDSLANISYPLCNGGTGSATIGVKGGTVPYSYTWTRGVSTTATATNILAGSYTVVIKDANSCSSTVTFTMTQPNTIRDSSIAADKVNVSCNGGNNGSATIGVMYGTSPYSYLWSNGQTTATASGLSAGIYSVTVTDNNGCTGSATVGITQTTTLKDSVSSQVNVRCIGGNSGTAAIGIRGGTSPYTFLWSPIGKTTQSVTGLSAGTYTVTITDNHGCSNTTAAIITQPGVLSASPTASPNVSCNGGSNGGATANPIGGTAPYTYLWFNGKTTASITGLSAGTYSMTIHDNCGGSTTASVIISQPVVLSATATANPNSGCSGSSSGSATANPSGGTSPYTYLWSDASSQTNANATGLSAGSYTVAVHDINGCSTSASVTITQAPALFAAATINSNVTCNGGNNGSAAANPSGGTSPYNYVWSDAGAQTNDTATGLVAGTYTVTVTDANNCSATSSVTISQTLVLSTPSTVNSNVSCNGGSGGSATANPSGGTLPYTYSWSNGSTNGNATGLSAGTYTVTVSDNCSASATASVIITQPGVLSTTANVNSNVTCNGGNNGSATASPNGGVSPYNYVWSDAGAQTNSTATGLIAGTYTVTVTDVNNCSATASVTISQPIALSTTANANTNVSCNGGSGGSATANPSGGTLPYTYSWSNGGTNGNITGLSAGTYTVTVSDNCSASATASVTITQPADALSAAATINSNVTCNGGNNGSAAAKPSGGTSPYNYVWSDAGAQTNDTATGLVAGTYTVTVTDANNCSATSSVTISQPIVLSTTANVNSNVSCNGGSGGSATANPSGGTLPYTYSWSNGSTNGNATGLSAGTYTVTVSDNCSASATASVIITQPGVLSTTANVNSNVTCNGGNNGSATASPSGGVSPYNYVWSDAGAQTNSTATGLIAGTYTVTVTDANNCSATASIIISQPIALSVSIPASTNITCNGAKNGTATALAAGGNSPYTYAWSNGLTGTSAYASTSASATSMPGTYTYTVTVHDQCGATATATVVISNPAVISATFTKTSASACGNVLGTATASPTGGTPPYVSYSWSSGSTTSTATGLGQATYTVVITDNNGCTGSPAVNITKAAPLAITFTSVVNVGCNGGNGGRAQASIMGGTGPYTFSWSNGQTSQTAINLSAGTYTLTLFDSYNCSTTAPVTITQPAAFRDSLAAVTYPACNGNKGSATIGVSGGTAPYNYSWSNGITTASGTNLAPSGYTVTIKDNHSCSTVFTFSITQPAALRDSISSSTCSSNLITATVGTKGGTNPYSYAWSPGGGSQATVSGLAAGTYTIVITDSHNCSNTIRPNLACVPSVLSPEKDTNAGKIKCCQELGNINLYPNPSTGQLNVAGLKAGMVVEMYDYTGRKITGFTASGSSMQFNITDQPNGIYLVRILAADGSLVSEKKVVKTQ